MENLTTAISVQLDSQDKEIATGILKKLGLNMSTYVNMAIKQLINKDGVPFEIVNPKPSKDMLEALEELEYAKNHPDEYKGYHNINAFIEDMLKWILE